MVAALVLQTGCKKEQEFVTLGVDIQRSNAKMYINGDNYPYWTAGDRVYVNDQSYPVTNISGSSATIEQVVANNGGYRAVFPASIVASSMDITGSTTIPVTLPAIQQYQLVDGHQRVNLPMGAYLDGGTRLVFNNLCSVVRVEVSNALSEGFTLDKIVIETATARLSGDGTATVDGNASNAIAMSADASHKATLSFALNPVTIAANTTTPVMFDIVVPEFATDNVTITLYTTNGKYFSRQITGALAHNTVTSVSANVTNLQQILAAELVDGPTFNVAIPNNATAVVFEYNSSVTSGTLLSTADSPVPIYGNLVGTTWRVSTLAPIVNANISCVSMFQGILIDDGYGSYWTSNLQEIEFGDGFNTSNVMDMSRMFCSCVRLISLDVTNFNTANVTDMSYMFYHCSNLTGLDISNFNTANVYYMNNMFEGCSGLTSLNVSNFNTSNVTNMSYMFGGCGGLTSLDVSNFNTANVTDMSGMFMGCDISNLDLSNFNTGNVTDMSEMFLLYLGQTGLDLSNFNTSNVTNMAWMFGWSELTSLDLSSFNTENVTNMSGMFYTCFGLTSLDLSNFNTENVTDMSDMFEFEGYGSPLTSLNLSNFNTEKVTNMSHMFTDCMSLTSLDLSHFDMSNVNEKGSMCSGLSTSSGHCTITCPLAVQTAMMESDTYLPTSGVTFTWVRP